MKTITSNNGTQSGVAGRRSFLRKLSAAAGAVIVTTGAVATAAPALPARKDEVTALTPQQRLLLARFNEMSDVGQAFMLNMAEFNSRHLPREFPNVTVMPRGAV